MKGVCFTGHRPEKFPFPFDSSDDRYLNMQKKLYSEIKTAIDNGYTKFYTGMAQGFDILATETVLSLKRYLCRPDIEIICALPFEGFSRCFDNDWQDRYNFCISNATEIVIVNDRPSKWAYLRRNDYLLAHADLVITFFDGKGGGTKYTVRNAVKCGREVVNLALPA